MERYSADFRYWYYAPDMEHLQPQVVHESLRSTNFPDMWYTYYMFPGHYTQQHTKKATDVFQEMGREMKQNGRCENYEKHNKHVKLILFNKDRPGRNLKPKK